MIYKAIKLISPALLILAAGIGKKVDLQNLLLILFATYSIMASFALYLYLKSRKIL
jgi:hypothetical protein